MTSGPGNVNPNSPTNNTPSNNSDPSGSWNQPVFNLPIPRQQSSSPNNDKENEGSKESKKAKPQENEKESVPKKEVKEKEKEREGDDQAPVAQGQSQMQAESVHSSELKSQVSSSATTAQINKVAKLVGDMLSEMKVGKLEGKDLISMQLKAGDNVPDALVGTKISLSVDPQKGMTLNFETTDAKLQAVQKIINADAAQQISDRLAMKGFQIDSKNIQVNGENVAQTNQPQSPMKILSAGKTSEGKADSDKDRDPNQTGRVEGKRSSGGA